MSKSSAARWVKFFNAGGIPSPAAASYAHIFVENRIQEDMLLDLNKEYLREMGITPMGDIIAILRHAKQVTEQHVLDKVMIHETPQTQAVALPLPKPKAKPVMTSSTPPPKISSNSKSTSSPVTASGSYTPPLKPARRVLPEHEGKYKVTLPSGTTERSKQILAKREQLYSDRVSSSKKADVFSRLHNKSDDDAQEGIVSSSGESNVRVHITGVHSKTTTSKVLATSSNNSVFARLGGKQSLEEAQQNTGLAKEIKSILKNSTQPGGAKRNTPIVKAKNIVTTATVPRLPQQKVMLVHKVPLKRGDDSEDDSMDDLDNADVDSDDMDGVASDGDHYDTDMPMTAEKIVKFASTAEVREIAPHTSYKPRGSGNFARNIKSRLGLVSKLHATRKTYNLKASPTKKPGTRPSPVKGKAIRMRSDEVLTRQDTLPVHRRLGGNAGSAPASSLPPQSARQRDVKPHYSVPRRHASFNGGHKPRVQANSVFDRLGFNNSL